MASERQSWNSDSGVWFPDVSPNYRVTLPKDQLTSHRMFWPLQNLGPHLREGI